MPQADPQDNDYLAVVSEWSRTTPRGGSVGNAYPLVCLTTGQLIADPDEEFPNPGAVFLTNRGNLKTWDFVVLRPRKNNLYDNSDNRQCFYIPFRIPDPITQPSHADNVATILDYPGLDLNSGARQLINPRHNVTPVFFLRKGNVYYGPLARTHVQLSPMEDVQRIDWRPLNEDGIFYEFSREELLIRGLTIGEYSHPDPALNRVISSPIPFLIGDVQRVTSNKPRDVLAEAALIDWYLQRCPGVEISATQLTALKAAFRFDATDHPPIIHRRLEKIEREMQTNIAFLEQRDRFARQYLESDAGKQNIQELMEQAIAKRGHEIQAEVDQRQSRLAARRNELSRELSLLEEEHRKKVETLEHEREAIKNQTEEIRRASELLQRDLSSNIDALATRMQEQLPLFAALSSVQRPQLVTGVVSAAVNGAEVAPTRSAPRVDFRPVPPAIATQPILTEGKLVNDLHSNLARNGLTFARDFVANVYTCLKAEPLNLIIGPPGYGKSMLVTTLARIMGHGNALLRIAVRRSWGEDRYLLGSFDSFHDRYDPGPTGLVSRMLQARADWVKDKQGIYMILLDEFNLAAPEYYFSQLLQALPSDDPVREVALYDDSLANADGFPGKVTLVPSLRFWGTINYDETTERLSPRTLDRTGMIFVGDTDVKSTVDDDLPAMPGVSAKDLFEKFVRSADQCPEEHWSLVSKVIDLLRRPEPDLGPRVELSPRVRRAIRRYLANSVDVLAAVTAVDYAVQQRILPVIRGRGEDFMARIQRLAGVLSENNLQRSALHVEEAIRRSEQQFGEVDFLTY
jgi:energy-coupling factor transporter ATP-binding protein EcfA2